MRTEWQSGLRQRSYVHRRPFEPSYGRHLSLWAGDCLGKETVPPSPKLDTAETYGCPNRNSAELATEGLLPVNTRRTKKKKKKNHL